PGAEFSRLHEESLRRALGKDTEAVLQQAALDRKRRLSQRLRAVRLVAPEFDELSESFVKRMAKDASWEIRSQAAWLIGIRLRTDETPTLLTLLADKDAFVRRRAAEALTRMHSSKVIPALIERLGDPERLVRYVAMSALAHYPTQDWFEAATAKSNPQIRMRALVASLIRREPPPEDK